jgi:hypothetical protein
MTLLRNSRCRPLTAHGNVRHVCVGITGVQVILAQIEASIYAYTLDIYTHTHTHLSVLPKTRSLSLSLSLTIYR